MRPSNEYIRFFLTFYSRSISHTYYKQGLKFNVMFDLSISDIVIFSCVLPFMVNFVPFKVFEWWCFREP